MAVLLVAMVACELAPERLERDRTFPGRPSSDLGRTEVAEEEPERDRSPTPASTEDTLTDSDPSTAPSRRSRRIGRGSDWSDLASGASSPQSPTRRRGTSAALGPRHERSAGSAVAEPEAPNARPRGDGADLDEPGGGESDEASPTSLEEPEPVDDDASQLDVPIDESDLESIDGL